MSEKAIRLQIQQLRKHFGETTVLTDVNLTIEPGEFVAIVGRSGCGKSTLLRLIAGLDQPSQGSVALNGEPITAINQDTRVLFQEARLLPWKKVVDNVRIGTQGNDYESALIALEQVGLESRADEWPGILSGGQKQRVSLARALAGHPGLLLLDEPLGALDALTRIEMQQLIEQLWLEQQFTTILVTHDVSEAVALADRVILLEQGVIAMDTRIALARPRERDNGFAYYEKSILDRLLNRTERDALFPDVPASGFAI
ncbi:ATP-binding cassette domain-containing protein [Paenibacillus pinihumi]|uniref:ATP-binding cassette domain-containing protein n=1 Tax=Paenibacillus pinihumi TaxID=669462 RepID=UPI0003FCC257|nr:ATP-binding cassette domain-containing protein [Paenibacillus pinihumi]